MGRSQSSPNTCPALEALEGDVLGERVCVWKVRCKQQDKGEEDHNFPGRIPGNRELLEVKAATIHCLRTPCVCQEFV